MQEKTTAVQTAEQLGEGEERVVLEAAVPDEPEVPERILITPWGEVESSAGSFVVDEEAAKETIAAFERHGTDLPVDYEHQTLGGTYSSPSGQAPAAGWIKALSMVTPAQGTGGAASNEPGLWAEVEWTQEAREMLRGKQYRYLSPVALVRRADRRLIALHSVALTNKPAIVGMRPVVASEPVEAEPPGTVAGASPAAELRGLLALNEKADDAVVLVAAAERIRSLEQAEAGRQASERVGRAMSSGRLTAGQREWALSLAMRDPAEFDRWAESAPVVVPLGRLSPPPNGAAPISPVRAAVEAAARSEWHANRRFLEKVCTEAAYVAGAVREAGA
jgi:phage I-like protein